jgi:hypothetical protein
MSSLVPEKYPYKGVNQWCAGYNEAQSEVWGKAWSFALSQRKPATVFEAYVSGYSPCAGLSLAAERAYADACVELTFAD